MNEPIFSQGRRFLHVDIDQSLGLAFGGHFYRLFCGYSGKIAAADNMLIFDMSVF
jgi:hypothetical protein